MTKSLRCKLERGDIDLMETKTAFNEVVEYYYILINTSPSGLDIPVNKSWLRQGDYDKVNEKYTM